MMEQPDVSVLPDGIYPFVDQRLPLSEMIMVEAPLEMEHLLTAQAAANGIAIVRDEPVEITVKGASFPNDAVFLVYWPTGERMHILVPKDKAKGRG